MRIIKKKSLIDFIAKHPESAVALMAWYKTASRAEWKNFANIRKDFNSVDSVGNRRYVFNVKGNDFRLIVIILFKPKTIYIRFVGTHQDYDRITDIKNI